MDLFTTYTGKDNQTGETWTCLFDALDAKLVGAPENTNGLTYDQASRTIANMNRAQANHKNEVTYSLKA